MEWNGMEWNAMQQNKTQNGKMGGAVKAAGSWLACLMDLVISSHALPLGSCFFFSLV